MKIIICQNIICKNEQIPRAIHKIYESNIIPHKGDFIFDGLWNAPYQYEICEVILAKHIEKYHEVFDTFMILAKQHGWDENYPN